MIIMNKEATAEQIKNVTEEVKKYGLKSDVSKGEFRTVIGLIGDESRVDFDHLAALPGVKTAERVETPYKLISREYSGASEGKNSSRTITVKNVKIGNDHSIFITGPCAVESKEALMEIARTSKEAGAHILRGGIFKPRSSVHSFQGLGSAGRDKANEALSWLREAGEKYDMPTITEVRGESQVELVAEYVDILQIGSRNMYNQDLLAACAKTGKPVLLKRHFGASVEEFLSFAEYIAAEGNKNIILCERGIVPVGKGKNYTRYNLDLSSVPVIQKETYLPVVVDPSHATGRRDLIASMCYASIAAGANGLMVEAHYKPEEAWVDGNQMIKPDELKVIIETCAKIRALVKS